MTHADMIKVLNDLIRMTEDRRRGFSDGARAVSAPKLGALLRVHTIQCESAAFELKGMVRSLGGMPARRGTISGVIHRSVALSIAALGNANVAVLGELKRIEEQATAAYARALNATLPNHVLCALRLQRYGVIRNCHLIYDLHNCYRNMGDPIVTSMLK